MILKICRIWVKQIVISLNQLIIQNQSKIEDNIFVSDFEDISLSNNKLNNSKLYKQFNSVVNISIISQMK